MTSYLNHITLDTGHVRRSPRSEVSQQTADLMTPHLARAIANGIDPLPLSIGGERPRLKATATGGFLLATVISGSGAPLATFGVARRSRGAARLWAMLHDGRKSLTHRADIPSAPWLAARLETTDIAELMTAPWLADYERCVAWAWIEGERHEG